VPLSRFCDARLKSAFNRITGQVVSSVAHP
jgi:hypothetical protein